eukprot:jgi/Chlat1/1424/Chrsp12S08677
MVRMALALVSSRDALAGLEQRLRRDIDGVQSEVKLQRKPMDIFQDCFEDLTARVTQLDGAHHCLERLSVVNGAMTCLLCCSQPPKASKRSHTNARPNSEIAHCVVGTACQVPCSLPIRDGRSLFQLLSI